MSRESDIAWFFKYLILALLGIALVYMAMYHERLRVYAGYFRTDAPEVSMRYELLSASMDEAAVRKHFSGVHLTCIAESVSVGLGDRVCYGAIDKADGAPALGLALFFRQGRLSRSIVQVPWWRHLFQKTRLLAMHGAPTLKEEPGEPAMLSWRKPRGQLLFNRDRSSVLNPLAWSIVMWIASGE